MLGWLFGGSEAADKTVDSVSSGIDKIFYTDEEKADASKESFKLFIKYQEATQPQNAAPRLIALIIIGMCALLTVVCLIAWPISKDYAVYSFDILSNVYVPLAVVIVSWYFYKRRNDK